MEEGKERKGKEKEEKKKKKRKGTHDICGVWKNQKFSEKKNLKK